MDLRSLEFFVHQIEISLFQEAKTLDQESRSFEKDLGSGQQGGPELKQQQQQNNRQNGLMHPALPSHHESYPWARL